MDAHANFPYSTVATAPSPATSGTSVVLTSAADFPDPATVGPYNVVIAPVNTLPLSSNAEVVRVTAKSTNTLTITRAQEGSAARTVIVGDAVIGTAITAKTFKDIETQFIRYTYDTTTIDADPGAGLLRFNDADPTLATMLYIDDVDYGGITQRSLLRKWGAVVWDTAPAFMGLLRIRQASDGNVWARYRVTAEAHPSGYVKLTVVPLSNSGVPFATTPGDLVLEFQWSNLEFAPIVSASAPPNPTDGQTWWDPDDTALAAAPTVVSVGAEFSGTGAPTATLPGTHALNDILVLILQSSNESNIAAPAGYTQLGPQNAIGAAATAGTTKLSIFWKRDGGSESAPTIPDTGDHTYGVMLAVRDCPTSGDPFHMLGNAFKRATSTAGTSPKGATCINNCLILDIFGHGIDNAGAQSSGQTNADLTGLTESFDDGTTDGTGGGIVVISGTKTTAGPIAATTITWANTTVDVSTRVAFIPKNQVTSSQVARPAEIQTFIGTAADLDDIFVKPTGARKHFAQICDGGQGGGGGRSSATAAGGGAGGGGGYDEAWYNADDLAATITVHAGKGGAGGAVDAVGNAGVVSEFDKGGVGPLTSARRIAGVAPTAAATADGGNGGGGSGRGTTAVAVQTTRLDAFGVSATRPSFAQGAAGGSGTTAPTGGGSADWGGGGGESGADTDNATTSANNGWSIRGAGGGSSGRTNTNASVAGFGGGAAAPSTQGASGNDSTRLPFGGSGGNGGGSSTAAGGAGGFPGGGGGGGGGVANGAGGRGADGCVVVTTFFS